MISQDAEHLPDGANLARKKTGLWRFAKYSSWLPAFCLLVAGFLALLVEPMAAQTNFSVLKSFSGIPDGAVPYNSLAVDSNHIFYGITGLGGVSNYGTIFSLKSDGSGYRILKSFPASTSLEGSLLLSTNGNLYGTSYAGGTSNLGTVFSIHRDGTGYSVLHSFTGGTDGANPEAGVIEGSDGVLYGTTYFANTTTRGTVFKINKEGSNYSILHNFTGTTTGDGQQVATKLLEGSDGALYGTTILGGSSFFGTLFTIAKSGSNYSIVHSFGSVSGDGKTPQAGLIEYSNQLYGTTYSGGTSNYGTVYKINKDGSGEQILHSFESVTGDAESPEGELLVGMDGALHGGTQSGGTNNSGAIYKLNTDGTGYQMLRNFTGANGDGQNPKGALVQLSNGIFYGITQYGGTAGGGCVFALSSSFQQPQLLPISIFKGSNVLQGVITSGLRYSVLRSSNLTSWSTIGTMAYPTNSCSDTNPPLQSAFYVLKQN